MTDRPVHLKMNQGCYIALYPPDDDGMQRAVFVEPTFGTAERMLTIREAAAMYRTWEETRFP